MMPKAYLTPSMIDRMLMQAQNPIWKMGVLAGSHKGWLSIIAVSKLNLIHFYGNTDTGWQHIIDRHGHYSDKNYFGDGAVGNPHKFKENTLAIFDFVNIADDVFQNGILDTRPHPDSLLFEKYKGKSARFTSSNGSFKDFFLVLYRNTRIVHSVYPAKHLDIKPPKRILPEFARCRDKISAEKRIVDDVYTITVPYENAAGVIRYVFIIRLNENSLICKGYLQVNYANGAPYFSLYPNLFEFPANFEFASPPISDDINFTRFLNSLGYADFSELEKLIREVEGYLTK